MNDYDWTCHARASAGDDFTAESILRESWEGGPPALGVVLWFAWRFGLWLRLAPRPDAIAILGWHVVSDEPTSVTVDALSPLLAATNTVIISDGQVRWNTRVTYRNVGGRLLWMSARPIHQWLVPRLLDRAIERLGQ